MMRYEVKEFYYIQNKNNIYLIFVSSVKYFVLIVDRQTKHYTQILDHIYHFNMWLSRNWKQW